MKTRTNQSGTVDEAYARLGATADKNVDLGGALITMIEPAPGLLRVYDHWYQHDHMIAGALALPWVFAGRRWLAPKSIQSQRYPASSAIAEPLSAGKFISVYWFTRSHLDDVHAWCRAANEALQRGEGRMSARGSGFSIDEERRTVYTHWHDYLGATYRDDSVVRDVFALSYPFCGLVFELFRARPGLTADDVDEWLRTADHPHLADRGVALSMRFCPQPRSFSPHVKPMQDVTGIVAVLHLLDEPPTHGSWQEIHKTREQQITQSDAAEILLGASFIPTVPGTQQHLNELF